MPDSSKPSTFNWGIPPMLKALRFAGKLQVFRNLKHLTIAEMADKCGISPKTLERLLSGDNAPSASTLKRIERTFELDFDPEDFEERE